MTITKTMSDNEIRKELKSINAIIKNRYSGYMMMFAKELKNKAYKHNDVLGVKEYMVNGNRVLVCFQKFVATNKLSNLWVTHIVVTEDNGAFITYENERGNIFFNHFTNHAIDRIRERTGLTLKDFFVNELVIKADTTFNYIKYEEYGYDDSTYIVAIGRCFFIVSKCENKVEVKTTLDKDDLYSNQMRLYIDSKRGADKFADKMYYKIADNLKESGFKKTSDFIKMCA